MALNSQLNKYYQQEEPRLGNQYLEDSVLRAYLKRLTPPSILAAFEPELVKFGERVAPGGDILEHGRASERNPPRLTNYNAFGRFVCVRLGPHHAFTRLNDLLLFCLVASTRSKFILDGTTCKIFLRRRFVVFWQFPVCLVQSSASLNKNRRRCSSLAGTHCHWIRTHIQGMEVCFPHTSSIICRRRAKLNSCRNVPAASSKCPSTTSSPHRLLSLTGTNASLE
jgi:hypothetical protein